MYETMVKEAYENILGIDKEAGILDNAAREVRVGKTLGSLAANTFKSDPKGTMSAIGNGLRNRAIERPLGTAATAAGVGLAAYGAKKLMDRGREKREENGLTSFSPASKMLFGRRNQQPTGTTITINSPMSKRAAAAYEEAQLVKQAAEADYAEACAYEEAALQILDELGYLD